MKHFGIHRAIKQKILNSVTSFEGFGQFNCLCVTCKVAGSLPFFISPPGSCAFKLANFFWENNRKPPSLCTEFWCLARHFLMALNCWLAWWDSILAKASSRWFVFWITCNKVISMIILLSVLTTRKGKANWEGHLLSLLQSNFQIWLSTQLRQNPYNFMLLSPLYNKQWWYGKS